MEVVANPQNNKMYASPYVAGVVSAPDKLYKPTVPTSAEISRKVMDVNKDVYSKEKKSSRNDNLKTPVSVLCVFGALALATLIFLVKKFAKHK